ncbi:unnamed protein product [Adineta steineri]|uniref:Uncharacterized protein n=1 Tax=Adineta steineri TaxID=433720 RepID=A0A815ZSM3_9BILA|nr:unnamed protein product [Adineta steineri]CAF1588683.1 unnamed protein product [Adineta steineri]CAF1677536.1 unnamed protein product [Adineta steineri]CAF1677547.1 unnamed protein product [Adineta steineri]
MKKQSVAHVNGDGISKRKASPSSDDSEEGKPMTNNSVNDVKKTNNEVTVLAKKLRRSQKKTWLISWW